MPGFRVDGTVVANYAAFSKQCGLCLLRVAISDHAEEIAAAGFKAIQTGITFPPRRPIPDGLVERLARASQTEATAQQECRLQDGGVHDLARSRDVASPAGGDFLLRNQHGVRRRKGPYRLKHRPLRALRCAAGLVRVVTRQYAFDDIVSLDGIVASEGGDECVSHPRPRSRSPCLRMTNA